MLKGVFGLRVEVTNKMCSMLKLLEASVNR